MGVNPTPPFAFVSMKQVEAFPLTDLYGCTPIGEDKDEDEDDGHTYTLRSNVVRLHIGTAACEKLQETGYVRRLPPLRGYDENDGIDDTAEVADKEIDEETDVSNIDTSSHKQRESSSVFDNGTPVSTNKRRKKKKTTATATQPSLNNTSSLPIPPTILAAAHIIHGVNKNKDNLPMKCLLWSMEGFVSSKGHMKADNPLREWYGDTRLFDEGTWRWLAGVKE